MEKWFWSFYIIIYILVPINCDDLWTGEGKSQSEIDESYCCIKSDMWGKYFKNTHGANRHSLREFMKFIGSPHLQIPTFHVTGTNGKGGVVHKIAAMLNAAGYPAGEYTSPKLLTHRENIQVNGTIISQADYVKYHQICTTQFLDWKNNGTRRAILGTFGIEFCMAFKYYLAKKAAAAIIEVNIGGARCHTNMLNPEVAIITNVALSRHRMYFPNSTEGIMREKSGIIKHNKPVVFGYDLPLELAKTLANKKNSTYYVIYPDDMKNFTYHQLNAKIARKALELAKDKFPNISEEAFEIGSKAKMPSRLEEVSKKDLEFVKQKWNLQKLPFKVYLEMKNDVYAQKAIFREMRLYYPNKQLRVVVTMSRPEDGKSRIQHLLDNVDYVHLITSKIKHAINFENKGLREMAEASKFDMMNLNIGVEKEDEDMENFVRKAFEGSSNNEKDEILIIILDYNSYKILQLERERDPVLLKPPTHDYCKTKFTLSQIGK